MALVFTHPEIGPKILLTQFSAGAIQKPSKSDFFSPISGGTFSWRVLQNEHHEID
jgi:hypothetical protein